MQTAKKQIKPNSLWVAVRRRSAKTLAFVALFLFVVSVSALSGAFSYTRAGAYAATSNTLNFQARLLGSTGNLVADGSYNIEFNLYTQQAPGGTTQWTETHTVLGGNAITLKNGYFSVSLGDSTTGTAFPGTIAWDQEQYLGMTVRGTGSCSFGSCTPADAEMTPRFKLTAVPYAFRAAKLMDSSNTNAFTADDLIQKGPSSVQAINLALAAIRLNQSGAGGLLQLQGAGSDVFTVANNGDTYTAGTLSVQGQTTLSQDLIANSSATGTTATTEPTLRSNVTTITTSATHSFAVNDVILINNAGQDYYTRVTATPTGTSLTVSPSVSYDASVTITKYTVQNVGAKTTDYTTQSNRFFQGYFLGGVVVGAGSTTLSDGKLSRTTGDIIIQPGAGGAVQVSGTINATTLTGDGSSVTNINGANITGSSIGDGSLSANVALLSGTQTFTGTKTFSAQLIGTAGLAVNGAAATLNTTGTALTSIGNATGAATLTGSSSSTFVLNGITIDASEFNRLDGKDAALLDINDSVNTAITGTGALATGSIASGFGTISTTNDITTTTNLITPILTSTAGLTISSGGSSDITLDSASNTIIIAASDTTLKRTSSGVFTVDLSDAGSTTLTLSNSGAGVADLNLGDGGLQTAGTSRLTNGGALQNITGLTVASGGASITGTATFVNNIALNGNTTIGDATTDRATFNSQILGSNGLVFQGATDDGFSTTFAITDPTANNTITVPDASGIITLIGTVSAQIDSGTNSSIFINKTGASGNLLTLQKSGTTVFSVNNSGSLYIANTTTEALNIKSSGGTIDIFNVNTSGNIVSVGSSAVPDGTAIVFVQDVKNTVSDPTSGSAISGAQYYNSFWQQYRCYREFAWETCGTTPIDRAFSSSDEFMSGTNIAACTLTSLTVGEKNWVCNTNGTTIIAYNNGTILPSADHPGVLNIQTGTGNGQGVTLTQMSSVAATGSMIIAANNRVISTVGVGATIANTRLRVGLHAEAATNIRPVTGVWWEADSTTNAFWNYCYGTSVAAVCAPSTLAVAANTFVTTDINVRATGVGLSSVIFTINGTSYTVSAVTVDNSNRVSPAIACFNSVAAARNCYVDYFQVNGVASARR